MSNLEGYIADELAKRVEEGSDSSGQKAESILIAKALFELRESVTGLKTQIPITSSDIKINLSKNAEKITESMDALKKEINTFSLSSGQQAKTLNFWTKGLVFVTVALVTVTAIFSYLQYKIN